MPENIYSGRVIISDTSCLIGLSNVNLLDILRKVYLSVTITPEVAAEYGGYLPEWIVVQPVSDTMKTAAFHEFIDLGESSSIALATETEGALLIIDDLQARQFAENLGLEITGTLGVLIQARHKRFLPDFTEVIAKLRAIGFRLPSNAEQLV